MDCNINFAEFNTPLPWIETLKNIYRDSDISDLEERTRILKEYLNNAKKYTNQNDYFKGSIKAIRERFRRKKRGNDRNSSSSNTPSSSGSSSSSNDLKGRIVKLEVAVEELNQLLRNTIDAHILPPTLSKTVDVQCGQETLINKSNLYYEIQHCFSTNAEFLLNFKELSEYLQGPGPYKTLRIKKIGGALIPLFKLIDQYISKQLKVAPVVDILKQNGDPKYIVEVAPNKISGDANAFVEQEGKDLYPHNIVTIEGEHESDVLFSLQKLWNRFYDAKNVVCSRSSGRFLDPGLVWKILISILIHELYHIRFYLTEVRDDEDEYGLDTSQEFILYSQKFIQS
jgi:hypothetical protein